MSKRDSMMVEMPMTRTSIRILPGNAILAAIGLLDLLTTLAGLRSGCIVEANPVMSGLLAHSLVAFISVKLLTLAAFVLVIEWYRRRSERAAAAVSTFTASAYLIIYAACFLGVNSHFILG
jgi:hypothetical protein